MDSGNPLMENNFERILDEFDQSAIEVSELENYRKKDQKIETLEKINERLEQQVKTYEELIATHEANKKFSKQKNESLLESLKQLKKDYQEVTLKNKKTQETKDQQIQSLNKMIDSFKEHDFEIKMLKNENSQLLLKINLLNRQKEELQRNAKFYHSKCNDLEDKIEKGQTQASQSNELSNEHNSMKETLEDDDLDEDINGSKSIMDRKLIKELEKNLWKSVDYSKQMMFLNNLIFWAENKIEKIQEEEKEDS